MLGSAVLSDMSSILASFPLPPTTVPHAMSMPAEASTHLSAGSITGGVAALARGLPPASGAAGAGGGSESSAPPAIGPKSSLRRRRSTLTGTGNPRRSFVRDSSFSSASSALVQTPQAAASSLSTPASTSASASSQHQHQQPSLSSSLAPLQASNYAMHTASYSAVTMASTASTVTPSSVLQSARNPSISTSTSTTSLATPAVAPSSAGASRSASSESSQYNMLLPSNVMHMRQLSIYPQPLGGSAQPVSASPPRTSPGKSTRSLERAKTTPAIRFKDSDSATTTTTNTNANTNTAVKPGAVQVSVPVPVTVPGFGSRSLTSLNGEADDQSLFNDAASCSTTPTQSPVDTRPAKHYNYLASSPRDEFDCAELLRRPSSVPLSGREMVTLFGYLLSLTPEALVQFQQSSRSLADSDGLLDCHIDKYTLTFGGQSITTETILTETVHISLSSRSAKPSARFTCYLPPLDSRYKLTVSAPSSGRLRKPTATTSTSSTSPTNTTNVHPFKFTLQYKTIGVVRIIIMIEVRGGYRQFLVVNTESATDSRLQCDRRCWDPYATTTDAFFAGVFHNVPAQIAQLHRLLVAKQGLDAVGIFREKGAPWDVQTLQARLGSGETWECNDVHAISTCIKLQLRSACLCAGLPADELVSIGSRATGNGGGGGSSGGVGKSGNTSSGGDDQVMADAWAVLQAAFEGVSQGKTNAKWDLMLWTLDLMALVVKHSPVNQMGIRSVATAFAPNLYTSSDTIAYMRVMQHLVTFLTLVLRKRMDDLGVDTVQEA
ncbi:hypothetical protein BC831DRAFT_512018 [Entophlyctis helioformis]|nr:hypothetical protein BC831DRAFT_512018 [Entophlyctis helioformis]